MRCFSLFMEDLPPFGNTVVKEKKVEIFVIRNYAGFPKVPRNVLYFVKGTNQIYFDTDFMVTESV